MKQRTIHSRSSSCCQRGLCHLLIGHRRCQALSTHRQQLHAVAQPDQAARIIRSTIPATISTDTPVVSLCAPQKPAAPSRRSSVAVQATYQEDRSSRPRGRGRFSRRWVTTHNQEGAAAAVTPPPTVNGLGPCFPAVSQSARSEHGNLLPQNVALPAEV